MHLGKIRERLQYHVKNIRSNKFESLILSHFGNFIKKGSRNFKVEYLRGSGTEVMPSVEIVKS